MNLAGRHTRFRPMAVLISNGYITETMYNYGGGGSRTPVRKALPPEAYMLSRFACGPTLASPPQFALRAQNVQETRRASPIGLAVALRTETRQPAR